MSRILLVSALLLLPAPAHAAKIVLVAGWGAKSDDAPATECKLVAPFGIDFDRAGHAYLAEMTGHRLCRIDAAGRLTVLAGNGQKGEAGDGGPARQATFNGPHNLAVTPDGEVYVADTWNNRVRKIDTGGRVTTVAGTGRKGFSGDGGPAAKAEFGGIYCVTLSPDGKRLYAADLDNRRIRVIDLATDVVTTVAGNGKKGVPDDGAKAVDAPLVDPRADTVDEAGNVYVLERGGHALRVVGSDGRIRTVVGTGMKGSAGDGGDARKAQLNGPKHMCIDRDGTVIIADTENHCVRRYDPKMGRIERVAGTGRKGAGGVGGPPEQAELSQPHGVTVHRDGTLYIADSSNNRVLKIVPGP
jgi:DNA-binding beta-propeller fold protein YncE